MIRKQSQYWAGLAMAAGGQRKEGCLIRSGERNEPRSPLRYNEGYLRGGRSQIARFCFKSGAGLSFAIKEFN